MTGLLTPLMLDKVQTGGIWTVVLLLAVILIRQIGPWRKQATEASDKLIEQLSQREASLTERVDKLEAALKQQQSIHDAERALDRHRINNLTACLDSLLLLLQAAPEKAAQHVEKINSMRKRQQLAEAEEKGLIAAAKIVASEPPEEGQ
ncbi:hypothetical protein [Sphingomonas sp. LHG3406-1]|uniref:hypothetical protein n=1 Tax=Sphingomonas sp. LHG3406-1 TaxID=2804617 RepID=UPI00260285CD|nr:hypothetical protein [Sphingomonas sp. LHG3406-1]